MVKKITVVLAIIFLLTMLGGLFVQADTNSLSGKTALFSGDSIAAGWRDTAYGKKNYTNGGGWAARLENEHNMVTTKAAVAGQSFTVIEDRGHIIEQLHDKQYYTFDYVILQGGFNDCMGENNRGNSNMEAIPKLGTVSSSFDVNDFDTATFAGSFEELMYYATRYFPKARIGFIVTYATPDSQYGGITDGVTKTKEGYTQADYFNLQMAICEKWSVPYLNLYSGTAPDGKTYSGDIIDVDGGAIHFPGNGDNIHLNTAGYDVITPYIAEWMETLQPYVERPGAVTTATTTTTTTTRITTTTTDKVTTTTTARATAAGQTTGKAVTTKTVAEGTTSTTADGTTTSVLTQTDVEVKAPENSAPSEDTQSGEKIKGANTLTMAILSIAVAAAVAVIAAIIFVVCKQRKI